MPNKTNPLKELFEKVKIKKTWNLAGIHRVKVIEVKDVRTALLKYADELEKRNLEYKEKYHENEYFFGIGDAYKEIANEIRTSVEPCRGGINVQRRPTLPDAKDGGSCE